MTQPMHQKREGESNAILHLAHLYIFMFNYFSQGNTY